MDSELEIYEILNPFPCYATDYFQESCGGKLCAKLVSLPIFLVHDCNKQYEATATATKIPIMEAAIAFESRKK